MPSFSQYTSNSVLVVLSIVSLFFAGMITALFLDISSLTLTKLASIRGLINTNTEYIFPKSDKQLDIFERQGYELFESAKENPLKQQIVSRGVGYYTSGNQILTAQDETHTFRGVVRPSLEWGCGEGVSISDYERIAETGANVVRLPLNQYFWLEAIPCKNMLSETNESISYAEYVDQHVDVIQGLGMDVILDLHWSEGNGTGRAAAQRMPDERSVEFWRQVATTYSDNLRVLFELYNEPHGISGDVWRNGGDSGDGYEAVGMQELLDVIRNEVGAVNLVIVGGVDWGYRLAGLEPLDGENIVYSSHPYGMYPEKDDAGNWDSDLNGYLGLVPLIFTEFGDNDVTEVNEETVCGAGINRAVIDYAESNDISWVAWAWYPGGCGFPALIQDWDGTPSAAGEAVFERLSHFSSI